MAKSNGTKTTSKSAKKSPAKATPAKKEPKPAFSMRTFTLGNSGKECTVYSQGAYTEFAKKHKLPTPKQAGQVVTDPKHGTIKRVQINSSALFYVTNNK